MMESTRPSSTTPTWRRKSRAARRVREAWGGSQLRVAEEAPAQTALKDEPRSPIPLPVTLGRLRISWGSLPRVLHFSSFGPAYAISDRSGA